MIRILSLLLILLAQLATTQAALAWPVTEFKVFWGKPWLSGNTAVVEAGRALEETYGSRAMDLPGQRPAHIPQSTAEDIERYLAEVARWYRDMGYMAPKLEPVFENDNGQQAFRIYVYDITEFEKPAFYRTDCYGGALRRVIEVDARYPGSAAAIGANGKITDKGYQDLAHELFHAVAASYPLILGNCSLGDWIVEGTAQAMGIEAARRFRGVNLENDMVRWGLRRYHTPLRVKDDPGGLRKDDAYQSSSFWLYLGEKVALNGGNPGPALIEPDMSYLHEFFLSHVAGGISEANELNWIDQRLLSHESIGQKLNRIYPNFVTTFASHIGNRLVPGAATVGDVALGRWLGFAFEDCPRVIVGMDEAPIEIPVRLDTVAARCWMAGFELSGTLAVQVTAKGGQFDQLSQLTVGTQHGVVVAKPKIVSVGGEELAHWLFRVEADGREDPIFIISNVAAVAGETVPVDPTIEITVSGWSSNLEPGQ